MVPTLDALRRAARRFQQDYLPLALPDRFEMLKTKLGINKTRLLRLLGFSREEAARESRDLKEVIPEVMDRAREVEDLLCELLGLYGYNWQALAEDLQRPARQVIGHDDRTEPERVTRHGAIPERLLYQPDEDEIILNLIMRGGPETLANLRDFLRRTRA